MTTRSKDKKIHIYTYICISICIFIYLTYTYREESWDYEDREREELNLLHNHVWGGMEGSIMWFLNIVDFMFSDECLLQGFTSLSLSLFLSLSTLITYSIELLLAEITWDFLEEEFEIQQNFRKVFVLKEKVREEVWRGVREREWWDSTAGSVSTQEPVFVAPWKFLSP